LELSEGDDGSWGLNVGGMGSWRIGVVGVGEVRYLNRDVWECRLAGLVGGRVVWVVSWGLLERDLVVLVVVGL
jgi:hypothetical protein